jgi:hypothetical protein
MRTKCQYNVLYCSKVVVLVVYSTGGEPAPREPEHHLLLAKLHELFVSLVDINKLVSLCVLLSEGVYLYLGGHGVTLVIQWI